MAKNGTVIVNRLTWTELTDSNITAATWQVQGANDVRIQATVGATPPTDLLVGILYSRETREGESTLRTLADLFPGVSGANRLYGLSDGKEGSLVFISHA